MCQRDSDTLEIKEVRVQTFKLRFLGNGLQSYAVPLSVIAPAREAKAREVFKL